MVKLHTWLAMGGSNAASLDVGPRPAPPSPPSGVATPSPQIRSSQVGKRKSVHSLRRFIIVLGSRVYGLVARVNC